MGIEFEPPLGDERAHGMATLDDGLPVFLGEFAHPGNAFDVLRESPDRPNHLAFHGFRVLPLAEGIQDINGISVLVQEFGQGLIAGAIFLHSGDEAKVGFGGF